MTTLRTNVITTKEAVAYTTVDVRPNPMILIPNNTQLKVYQHAVNTDLGSYHQIIGGTYANKYIEQFDYREVNWLEE